MEITNRYKTSEILVVDIRWKEYEIRNNEEYQIPSEMKIVNRCITLEILPTPGSYIYIFIRTAVKVRTKISNFEWKLKWKSNTERTNEGN